MDDLITQTATTLHSRLITGEISAEDLTRACLDRITAAEPEIRAWAWFSPDMALEEARNRDRSLASGAAPGPLHGIPVGIKDVIDTARMPTENGTPLDRGRIPDRDAEIVARLRAAGAVILGKTVTTELAFMQPSKTRNPINPDHTPGGSSSGSAAAVAAHMVPLAVGTQTGGSVIRPAAFCGIVGFKPTFGVIPTAGALLQSHSLDTLGVFARTVADAALVGAVALGDTADPPSMPGGPEPRLAALKPPGWDRADPEAQAAFLKFCADLGATCTLIDLPEMFEAAPEHRNLVNFVEMAHHFAQYDARGRDQLSAPTQEAMAKGRAALATDYLAALRAREALYAALGPAFAQADAILTPAALGPAPLGHATTGDSIFNGLWTYLGTPSVTLPLLTASNGLPMGVQLSAPRSEDTRLLRTADWLATRGAPPG